MTRSIVIAAVLTTAFAQVALASTAKTPGIAKVVLHDTAIVSPDGNGFFTLGEIADITGGTPRMRGRLSVVEVGRPPLDGYQRNLNLGDVALKLRQAGIDPVGDLMLTGAQNMVVTTGGSSAVSAASMPVVASAPGIPISSPTVQTAALVEAPKPQIVIKPGEPVTIILQDGAMTITALGLSMDAGGVGDFVRVHRDGMPTDIRGEVLDDHTVQMEM